MVEGGSKEMGGMRDGASLQDGQAGLVMWTGCQHRRSGDDMLSAGSGW